jgi:8-oxo-dGTP pyrophosphatase MutT (NUDIX family)
MTQIELIARAVIRRSDEILLAHKLGESNTFLPGGHIETGEYTVDALRRELLEELGVEAEIGEFVGLVEHKFTDKDVRYEEVNIIFTASIEEAEVASAEGHLEFKWVNPVDFEEENLLPSSFPRLLRKWLEDAHPFHYA